MDTNRGEDLAWVRTLDAAAAVYRLAEKVAMAGGKRLADQLTAVVLELPGQLSSPADQRSRTFRQLELLLELAERLGYVTPAALEPARTALAQLEEAFPMARVTTPAPPQPTSPNPSAAKPVPTPPRRLPSETSAIEPTRPEQRGPKRDEPKAGHGQDRIVVDGSNFLGRAPGYGLGDERAQERFLFRLQEYAHQHPAHRITVYFDGRHVVRQLTAGVEIHVTSGARPADDVIVDFLHELPAPDKRRCILVTDDRELSNRARQEGIRVESVAWLSGRFTRKEPGPGGFRQPGMNRGELSEWEQFFDAPPKRPGKG